MKIVLWVIKEGERGGSHPYSCSCSSVQYSIVDVEGEAVPSEDDLVEIVPSAFQELHSTVQCPYLCQQPECCTMSFTFVFPCIANIGVNNDQQDATI